MKKISVTLMAIALLIAVGQAVAQTTATEIKEGFLSLLTRDHFSVRYQFFQNPDSQCEIHLGYDNLDIRNNRTEAHATNSGYGAPYNRIIFNYFPREDNLTTTITTPPRTTTLDFNNLSIRFNDPDMLNKLNYMQLTVVAGDPGVTVSLTNVYLNGKYLGNFTAPSGDWSNATWHLAGYDFSQGFTLTGNITLKQANGAFSNGEVSEVEVLVGVVHPSAL